MPRRVISEVIGLILGDAAAELVRYVLRCRMTAFTVSVNIHSTKAWSQRGIVLSLFGSQ